MLTCTRSSPRLVLIGALLIAASCFLATAAPAPYSTAHASPAPPEAPVVPRYRYAGEFEPHAAMWLAWPTYDNTSGYPSAPVVLDLIAALAPYVPIKLAVPRALRRAVEKALRKRKLRSPNLSIHEVPYTDFWFRDMGPCYVIDDKGGKRMVDFQFNGWGLPATYDPGAVEEDEAVDRAIAAREKLDLVKTTLVSEGGNRELNGRGTMIAIERTELKRNPGLTRADLEAEYARLLGVTHVIWLKRGVVEDTAPNESPLAGETGSRRAYTLGVEHVDGMARFANATTVLLPEITEAEASESPIAAENRARIEENLRILTEARDQDGKPFTILRIPAARPIYYSAKPGESMYDWIAVVPYDDGHTFPAPRRVPILATTGYMNFVLSNGVVLVPRFHRKGMPIAYKERDEAAVAALQRAFPDRRIIPVDSIAVNRGGGGIHCITQHEPRGL